MAAKRPLEFKVIMIGDSEIGKTSLASVFVEGKHSFPQTYITTQEKDIFTKRLKIGDVDVNLKIWDLSGADCFRTITTYHYTNASGLMLCYSVGSEKSWKNIDNWIENAKMFLGEDEFNDLPKSLIGMRIDLRNKVVEDEKALQKSITLPNADFCLTSARRNIGVDEAFENLVGRILRQRTPTPVGHENGNAKERSASTLSSRVRSCTLL